MQNNTGENSNYKGFEVEIGELSVLLEHEHYNQAIETVEKIAKLIEGLDSAEEININFGIIIKIFNKIPKNEVSWDVLLKIQTDLLDRMRELKDNLENCNTISIDISNLLVQKAIESGKILNGNEGIKMFFTALSDLKLELRELLTIKKDIKKILESDSLEGELEINTKGLVDSGLIELDKKIREAIIKSNFDAFKILKEYGLEININN